MHIFVGIYDNIRNTGVAYLSGGCVAAAQYKVV